MTRHVMPIAATLLFLTLVTAAPAAAESLTDWPPRHFQIRTTNSRLRSALDDGRRDSATFRALIDRINVSDVVVYLEHDRGTLPRGIDGRLTFLSASGGFRYVIVTVAWDLTYRQLIAIIGHELQHAVEIAELTEVIDRHSFARAYRRIGHRKGILSDGSPGFDSLAAIRAGEQVLREVMR